MSQTHRDLLRDATGRETACLLALCTQQSPGSHRDLSYKSLTPACSRGRQENKQALLITALPIQWKTVSVQSRPFQGTSCILLYQHPSRVVETPVGTKKSSQTQISTSCISPMCLFAPLLNTAHLPCTNVHGILKVESFRDLLTWTWLLLTILLSYAWIQEQRAQQEHSHTSMQAACFQDKLLLVRIISIFPLFFFFLFVFLTFFLSWENQCKDKQQYLEFYPAKHRY